MTDKGKFSLTLSHGLTIFLLAFSINYWHQQQQQNQLTMTAFKDNLMQIRKSHQQMQQQILKHKSSIDDPEVGKTKFFHEHFDQSFNVRFLEKQTFLNDRVKSYLAGKSAKNDEYYTKNETYSELVTELFAGYRGSSIKDRSMYVKFVGKNVGYGVFANIDIPKDAYLGDYTGLIVRENVNTDYMWVYPSAYQKEDGTTAYYGIDGRHTGNILRFVNAHLKQEKINSEVVYFLRHDKWAVGYRALRDIRKDEQILVSYGKSYWESRPMHDPTNPDSGVENQEQLEETAQRSQVK